MPNRRQATIWTNVDPIHWRIYAALGGDKLKTHYIYIWEHITSSFWIQEVKFNQAINWWLVQDCSNSIANTLELLQSCTKPSILTLHICNYCCFILMITWLYITQYWCRAQNVSRVHHYKEKFSIPLSLCGGNLPEMVLWCFLLLVSVKLLQTV